MSFHIGHNDLTNKLDWTIATPNHGTSGSASLNPDCDGDDENDDYSGGETKSDTSSDAPSDVESTVQPMLEILSLGNFDSFVIDSQAGLTGSSVVAQFPCILEEQRFFVWLGTTEVSLFGKTTLMNLANLAESKGA